MQESAKWDWLAPEKPASSKPMLACVPKSCRELARRGSNFRV